MRVVDFLRLRSRPREVLQRAAFVAFLALASQVGAQPDAPNHNASRDAKAEATEHMRRGVEAYDKSDFESARVSFARAWAVTQHPAIAANLADVETRLGRYREGAEHWSFYLKNAPRNRDRSDGEEGLAECRKHVARLEISAEPKAVVSLDGQVVGEAPSLDELWVEPGAHLLEARLPGGNVASQRVVVSAGDTQQVALVPAAGKAASSGALAPAQAEPSAPARVQPQPVDANTSARTPVLVGGAAFTAVVLGVGVVFGLKAKSASDDAVSLSKKIGEAVGGHDGDTGACKSPSASVATGCATLGAKVDTARSARTTAKVAFIASGVLGVGTLAAYLLWPRSTSSSTALSFGPWHSSGVSGVIAEGSF
ncbi:MAG: hypothetical protein ACOY0T_37655 [Myxococcota bacterium]